MTENSERCAEGVEDADGFGLRLRVGAFVRKRRKSLAVLKLLLFLVVLGFVGRVLVNRFMAIGWHDVDFKPGYLAAAVLVQIGLMCLGPSSYFYLLRHLRSPAPWTTLFGVLSTVRLAKYLPGKVASTLGVMWMLRERGIPITTVGSVTALLQGLGILVSILFATPLMFWAPVERYVPMGWLWSLALIVLIVTALHPRVFSPVVNRLLARMKLPPLQVTGGIRLYAAPFFLGVAGQCLSGLTLWFIIRSLADVSPAHIALCASATAVAGMLGMLALFAPAGIGVREAVLLVILGQVMDPNYAAVVVLASRLGQVVAEIVLAAAGAWVLRTARAEGPRDATRSPELSREGRPA